MSLVDATNHGHTGSEKYKWCPNFKATQGIYNKLVVKFGEGGGGFDRRASGLIHSGR